MVPQEPIFSTAPPLTDILVGLAGADYLYGGNGDDGLIGGEGPDVLDGGEGFDMAVYWDSAAAVYVDLSSGHGYFGSAEGDFLFDIEGLIGSVFGDGLFGGAGNDTFDGFGGNDYLSGGDGNDSLYGNYGDDIILPGSGRDEVNGGFDNDTVDYSTGGSGVWASLAYGGFTGDAAGDTYAEVENLSGTYSGDYLQGDNAGNVIKGYDGNDWLWGEDGNDKLEGGWGIDMLVGGAGADTFIWKMTSETGATIADADRILDFDPTLDRIDLRQINADISSGWDQAFEFIGTGDFTAAGQLRWSIEGSETVVWMNTDSDLAPDAAIRLDGAPLLGIDNFML